MIDQFIYDTQTFIYFMIAVFAVIIIAGFSGLYIQNRSNGGPTYGLVLGIILTWCGEGINYALRGSYRLVAGIDGWGLFTVSNSGLLLFTAMLLVLAGAIIHVDTLLRMTFNANICYKVVLAVAGLAGGVIFLARV